MRYSPGTGRRISTLLYKGKEYRQIIIETSNGRLPISSGIETTGYDRVEVVDDDPNFVFVEYSLYVGRRNYRHRGEKGRVLIHKLTLIKEEVHSIHRFT